MIQKVNEYEVGTNLMTMWLATGHNTTCGIVERNLLGRRVLQFQNDELQSVSLGKNDIHVTDVVLSSPSVFSRFFYDMSNCHLTGCQPQKGSLNTKIHLQDKMPFRLVK